MLSHYFPYYILPKQEATEKKMLLKYIYSTIPYLKKFTCKRAAQFKPVLFEAELQSVICMCFFFLKTKDSFSQKL